VAEDQVPYSKSQYIELKKYTGQGILSTAEQYDKAILALSGGAFGVSIAFLKDIAPAYQEGTRCWLIIAWIAFVVAICSSLASFLVSISAFRHLDEFVDARQRVPRTAPTMFKQSWNEIIMGLNVLSLTCFVIGATFLAIFSFTNLVSKENEMSHKRPVAPCIQPREARRSAMESAITITRPLRWETCRRVCVPMAQG
jgi:hypothetical protein